MGMLDGCRVAPTPSMPGSHIYEGGGEWSLRRNLSRVLKLFLLKNYTTRKLKEQIYIAYKLYIDVSLHTG